MIRDYNVDPTYSMFARETLLLQINAGASLAAVEQAAALMPYAGKILSAKFYCATLTDADDSARVDVRKNGVSLLSAAVDPVAAGTTVTFTLTGDTFADGDRLSAYITTGSGDALIGTFTIEVRPLLGSLELVSSIQQS